MDPTEIDRRWDPALGVFDGHRGPVRLSKRESDLLTALVEAEGHPVPRDGSARSVDFTVRGLREKIELDPGDPRIILTVHGVGYRLGLATSRPPVVARELMVLGDRQVDVDLGVVHRLGDELPLTALQRDVLRVLVEAGGRIVGRDELLHRAWGRSRRDPRAVDALIHQLRLVLEPVPTEPRLLLTIRGVGYRLQLARPSTNLAPSPPPTIGRATELAAVLDACAEPGWVLLTGPPGVGKSHLAERACRILAERLSGGAWWVDAAPLSSASQLLGAIGEVFGLAEPPRDPAAVRALIARRAPVALVLDNLEQLRDAQHVLSALGGSGGHLLGTSSRALDIGGRTIPLGGLSPDEGRALFVQRAPAIGWDEGAIDALVALVDGMPLAIDLAARRASTFPPGALLDRSDRFELLSRREPTGRHGSVRAALDWAWQLCGSDERRALVACAAFRAPFPLDAAVAVSGATVEVIEALVDRSFLTRVLFGTLPVFRLHSLVREWVVSRREPDRGATERWRRWFGDRARLLYRLPESVARPEVDRTLPDLIAVAEASLEVPEDAARIAILLNECFWVPRHVVQAVVDPLLEGPSPFPSRPLLWIARLGWAYRDGGEPEQAFEQAIACGLDPAGWPARHGRVQIALIRGDAGGMDPGPDPPSGDDPRHRLEWLWRRGTWLLRFGGRPEEGMGLMKRGLQLARARGHHRDAVTFESGVAEGLGMIGADHGQIAEIVERSMLASEARGLSWDAATYAWQASLLRSSQGRRTQARALAERAVAAAMAIGNPLTEIRARLALLLADLEGDPSALLFQIGEVAALAHAHQDSVSLGMVDLYSAVCHARLDDVGRALAIIDQPRPEMPNLSPALAAVGALLDPGRPLPEPPMYRGWGRSVVLVVAHLRDGAPLTDRHARADRASSTIVRAVASIGPTICPRLRTPVEWDRR